MAKKNLPMSVIGMKVQSIKQEIQDLTKAYSDMNLATTQFGLNHSGSAVHTEMMNTLSAIRDRYESLQNQIEKFETSEKQIEAKVLAAASKAS